MKVILLLFENFKSQLSFVFLLKLFEEDITPMHGLQEKFLAFLKKKGFDVTSLDNLYRSGSKLNLKRLKKEKIDNLRIDITSFNKVNNIKKNLIQ